MVMLVLVCLSSPPIHFIFFCFYLNFSFPSLRMCLPVFALTCVWGLFFLCFVFCLLNNPISLSPLLFGFLDPISKCDLLINPLAILTGVGKTV